MRYTPSGSSYLGVQRHSWRWVYTYW